MEHIVPFSISLVLMLLFFLWLGDVLSGNRDKRKRAKKHKEIEALLEESRKIREEADEVLCSSKESLQEYYDSLEAQKKEDSKSQSE